MIASPSMERPDLVYERVIGHIRLNDGIDCVHSWVLVGCSCPPGSGGWFLISFVVGWFLAVAAMDIRLMLLP